MLDRNSLDHPMRFANVSLREKTSGLNPLQQLSLAHKAKNCRGKLMTLENAHMAYKLMGRPHELNKRELSQIQPATAMILDYKFMAVTPEHFDTISGTLRGSGYSMDKFAYIVLIGEYNYLIFEDELSHPSVPRKRHSR